MRLQTLLAVVCSLSFSLSCKKSSTPETGAEPSAAAPASRPLARQFKIGLVTDVGGRGDGSFNDSGLRGLELWSAGKVLQGSRYVDAPADVRTKSIPAELGELPPLPITPLVIQSKAQEDYEPNLQLLVDQGTDLTIGVGFMLENAVETVARRNPNAKFLLIDSPLMDAKGTPITLPNVRTVVFREEEGAFLAGALAGLVTQTQKIGFVGGMEVPLIKRFEIGFRAGTLSSNAEASKKLVAGYTDSFDSVAHGKQLAADMVAKGVDVLFHAAGTDGLGAIQAVKEAKSQGKPVMAIGVDSDQFELAPEAMLTSVTKRVDLAIYRTARDVVNDAFSSGDQVLGLKEGGVSLADVRLPIPDKAASLAKIDALRVKIASGEIKVPARAEELSAFQATH